LNPFPFNFDLLLLFELPITIFATFPSNLLILNQLLRLEQFITLPADHFGSINLPKQLRFKDIFLFFFIVGRLVSFAEVAQESSFADLFATNTETITVYALTLFPLFKSEYRAPFFWFL
jgi:hypothetical protein